MLSGGGQPLPGLLGEDDGSVGQGEKALGDLFGPPSPQEGPQRKEGFGYGPAQGILDAGEGVENLVDEPDRWDSGPPGCQQGGGVDDGVRHHQADLLILNESGDSSDFLLLSRREPCQEATGLPVGKEETAEERVGEKAGLDSGGPGQPVDAALSVAEKERSEATPVDVAGDGEQDELRSRHQPLRGQVVAEQDVHDRSQCSVRCHSPL